MALWPSLTIYKTNQPPNTLLRNQRPDPARGIYPRVDLPCVYLGCRQYQQLIQTPQLWAEVRAAAKEAIKPGETIKVYDGTYTVLHEWRYEEL